VSLSETTTLSAVLIHIFRHRYFPWFIWYLRINWSLGADISTAELRHMMTYRRTMNTEKSVTSVCTCFVYGN